MNTDTGLLPLGADLICRGGLLYRDMHTVMLPGSYLLLALMFAVAGANWFTCCIVALAKFLLTTGAILFLSRRLMSTWLAVVPALLFLGIGPPMCPFNYHHWDALLFLLLFAIAVSYLGEAKGKVIQLGIAAGITGALAALCLQTYVLPVAFGTAAGVWLMRRDASSWDPVLKWLAGLAAGALPIVGGALYYISSTGTFESMIDCTVTFVNSQYHSVNVVPYGYSNFVPVIVDIYSGWVGALAGVPWEFVKLVPLIVALGCVTAIFSYTNPKTALKNNPKVMLWIAIGLGAWLAELHRPDIKRLIWGSQVWIILVFYLLEAAGRRFKMVRAVAPIFTLLLIAGAALDGWYFYRVAPETAPIVATRRGEVRTMSDLSILAPLQKLTRPYDKVLVYPYDTSINFLSQTMFPSIYPFLQYRYNSPAQFEQTMAAMDSNNVRYVVWNLLVGNDSFKDFGFPAYERVHADQLVMEKYLREHYALVKAYGHYRLMRRKADTLNSAASR